MEIKIKRVYESPLPGDGVRVLIDRLWPRGLTKIQANVDHWFKELAPSTELRKWYDHNPLKFEKFREKYLSELSASDGLESFMAFLKPFKIITLLFASKDSELSNAYVLREALLGMLSP